MKKSLPFYLPLMLFLLLISSSCASSKLNVFPLDKSYIRAEQLYGRLKEISGLGAGMCKLRIIGFSGTEQLPIYALEIGKPEQKRKILVIGQHHGDEVLGIELSLALAETLLSKRLKDKKWKAILDNYQFWIIPTINPEGWRCVSSGEYQRKRKNNRDTDKSGSFDIRTDGVDLNRNYPVFWADQPLEPSGSPYYKGERPASEPEVQAVMALAEKQHFELAIFYHSSASGAYSENIYLPAWISSDSEQKQRMDALLDFAKGYAGLVKKDYQKGYYQVGEGNSSRVGNARNYFFHSYDTDAMLVEIGGVTATGISVIHPASSMKNAIVEKHLYAIRQSVFKRIK